jgi:hypothetical protein
MSPRTPRTGFAGLVSAPTRRRADAVSVSCAPAAARPQFGDRNL